MTTPLHAEPVFWASEWEGKGGLSRASHATEQEAIDNARWMNGRHFPLYAAAAPAPDGLREAVWQSVMRGGDAWGITDRVIALLAAAPAHEGKREAVEIVTEWLTMAEAVPTQTHGVLRYPPISQGELDAIALLAKGGGT